MRNEAHELSHSILVKGRWINLFLKPNTLLVACSMGARLQPAEPKIFEAKVHAYTRQQIKASRRATNHNVSSGIFICIYFSLDLHVIRLSLCCDKFHRLQLNSLHYQVPNYMHSYCIHLHIYTNTGAAAMSVGIAYIEGRKKH